MMNATLTTKNWLAQAVVVAFALAAMLLAPHPLPAQTLTTLYSFCSAGAASCLDGYDPTAPVVLGTDGNFYGTTYDGGGGNSAGTVFKLTPGGTLTTIYRFCSAGIPCTDGAEPEALIQGTDGNFYGTTYVGGAYSIGSIFKITPSGTLTTLYSFCPSGGYPCADGNDPQPGLVQGTDGNFHGTTFAGGANDGGTVFTISPSGTYGVLYSFCALGGSECTDGGDIAGGLIQGLSGSFYGSAEYDGPNGLGTIFGLSTSGVLTTLYAFCSQSQPTEPCTDGSYPEAGVIRGSDGSFYGTTKEGGAHNGGTIFMLTPDGTLTTLYNFCSLPSCADGDIPASPLLQASDGNFYGTVPGGGANYYGGIFRITPSGTYTLLYSFCSQGGSVCTDGTTPEAGLIQGSDGNLYGTTAGGGAYGLGTVFKLSLPATIVTLSTSGLNFQNVPLETQSAPMAVTVTNTGSANLIFAGGAVTVSGTNYQDFTITSDTCSGQTIAPTNTCSVSVAFTPTLNYEETAALNFPDNAAGSPQSVALTGTAALPVASLSTSSLTFASQTVGTTSVSQPVTLNNTGTGTLTLSSIATSGDFGQTNTCGSSVAASGSCTINVTFTPSTTGGRAGYLEITDNSQGENDSGQFVNLMGTGVAAEVAVPNVVGDTEAAATTAITGAGLAVGSVTIASSTTVPAGEVISESPAAGAMVSPGSAVNLTVSSGPPPAQLVNLFPSALFFPQQLIGATSDTQGVLYFNSGNAQLTLNNLQIAGPNAGDFSIVSGSACAVNSVLNENSSSPPLPVVSPATLTTTLASYASQLGSDTQNSAANVRSVVQQAQSTSTQLQKGAVSTGFGNMGSTSSQTGGSGSGWGNTGNTALEAGAVSAAGTAAILAAVAISRAGDANSAANAAISAANAATSAANTANSAAAAASSAASAAAASAAQAQLLAECAADLLQSGTFASPFALSQSQCDFLP